MRSGQVFKVNDNPAHLDLLVIEGDDISLIAYSLCSPFKDSFLAHVRNRLNVFCGSLITGDYLHLADLAFLSGSGRGRLRIFKCL